MQFKLIDLTVEAQIATITLNRPDKRNAMSDAMRTEFIGALEQVAADKRIKALVLTGAGKGFCAGGDISGMEKRMNAPGRRSWAQRLAPSTARPPHAIAAAHDAQAGHRGRQRRRVGARCRLRRWPATSSSQASTPVSPGRISTGGSSRDGGGMYFLPRRVGLVQAKELIFIGSQGRRLTRPFAWGIVDRKTPAATPGR
jgi:enoyl-CoA hydratase/carnithine racemase